MFASGEYQLVQEKFQFDTNEIVRIIDYGFRASFMENGRKHRMRADVARTCVELLRAVCSRYRKKIFLHIYVLYRRDVM